MTALASGHKSSNGKNVCFQEKQRKSKTKMKTPTKDKSWRYYGLCCPSVLFNSLLKDFDPPVGRGARNVTPHSAFWSKPVFSEQHESWYNIAQFRTSFAPFFFLLKRYRTPDAVQRNKTRVINFSMHFPKPRISDQTYSAHRARIEGTSLSGTVCSVRSRRSCRSALPTFSAFAILTTISRCRQAASHYYRPY